MITPLLVIVSTYHISKIVNRFLGIMHWKRTLHVELSGYPDHQNEVVVAVGDLDVALRVQIQSVGPVHARSGGQCAVAPANPTEVVGL